MPANAVETRLSVSEGETHYVTAHIEPYDVRPCDHEVPRATVAVRRIGWIDQKGRVYKELPSVLGFDGGSLMPLLIDPGCE